MSSGPPLANAPTLQGGTHAPAKRLGPVLAEIALIFAVFVVHAAWPAPDVNEAHYLGKARHFWNPEWSPGDFFLESADAHAVFYWLVGWLTVVMSLPAAAWCGRILTWWLMAWAWRRLSDALVPAPWLAVISAGLFVTLSEHTHMAGEWVVGGVEAKGFAYVLVLLALEALVRDRWEWALCLLGAASSLHVLVGGWSVVAVGLAWLCLKREHRPPWPDVAFGLFFGLILALPGLWFALKLDLLAAPEVSDAANVVYVYERLKHHLLPDTFEPAGIIKHVILIGVWLVLCAVTPFDAGGRRFRLVVMGSLIIGFVGVAIRFATWHDPELSAGILRYYWFRLGDALPPAGVAIVAMGHIAYVRRWHVAVGHFWLGAAVAVAGFHLGGLAVKRMLPDVPRGDRPGKVANFDDWREACEWIKDNSPADARFITPRHAQTFKWHASRAEVANWKDIPQNAEGTVKWWWRLRDLHWEADDEAAPDERDEGRPPEIELLRGDGANAGHWRGSLTKLTPARLRRLGQRYEAGFVVTEAEPRLDLRLLYANDTYAVYSLAPE